MKPLCSCLLVFCISLFPAKNIHAEWTHDTFGPGPAQTLVGSSEQSRFIAHSNSYGFWKTEDGGASWSPQNEAFQRFPFQVDEFIVVDVAADTIVCLGLGEREEYSSLNSIWVTVNGGDFWRDVSAAWRDSIGFVDRKNLFAVDPVNHDTWYYGYMHFLKRTRDRGMSWEYTNLQNYPAHAKELLIDPTDTNRLYTLGSYDPDSLGQGGVFRSLDGGDTWAQVFAEEGGEDRYQIKQGVVADNGTLLIQVNQHDFYRSENYGETWEQLDWSDDLDQRYQSYAFASRSNQLVIFAAGWGFAPLLRSEDYGESWTEVTGGPELGNHVVNRMQLNWSSKDLNVSFTDGKSCFLTFPWTEVTPIDVPALGPQISSLSLWSNTISAACVDGKVYTWSDNEETFSLLETTQEWEDSALFIEAASWMDEEVAIYRGWISQYDGDGSTSTRGVAIVHNRLQDQFQHFSLPSGMDYAVLTVFQRPEGLEILGGVTSDGSYFYSSDTCRTWIQGQGYPADIVNLYTNGNRLFTTTGTFMSETGYGYSEDGGQHWLTGELPGYNTFSSPYPPVWETGSVSVRANGYLYRLTESGEWEETCFVPASITHLISVPGIQYVGFDVDTLRIVVFETSNDFWQLFDSEGLLDSQERSIQMMQFDPYRSEILVATGASFARYAILTGMTHSPVSLPDGKPLVSSWPNPFNASTTITISLARPEQATVKVFDILGREVVNLYHGRLERGDNTLLLNGADLSSGTYFIEMQTSSSTISRRVTLLK